MTRSRPRRTTRRTKTEKEKSEASTAGSSTAGSANNSGEEEEEKEELKPTRRSRRTRKPTSKAAMSAIASSKRAAPAKKEDKESPDEDKDEKVTANEKAENADGEGGEDQSENDAGEEEEERELKKGAKGAINEAEEDNHSGEENAGDNAPVDDDKESTSEVKKGRRGPSKRNEKGKPKIPARITRRRSRIQSGAEEEHAAKVPAAKKAPQKMTRKRTAKSSEDESQPGKSPAKKRGRTRHARRKEKESANEKEESSEDDSGDEKAGSGNDDNAESGENAASDGSSNEEADGSGKEEEASVTGRKARGQRMPARTRKQTGKNKRGSDDIDKGDSDTSKSKPKTKPPARKKRGRARKTEEEEADLPDDEKKKKTGDKDVEDSDSDESATIATLAGKRKARSQQKAASDDEMSTIEEEARENSGDEAIANQKVVALDEELAPGKDVFDEREKKTVGRKDSDAEADEKDEAVSEPPEAKGAMEEAGIEKEEKGTGKEREADAADKEMEADNADKDTEIEGAEKEAEADAADKETESDATDKETEADAADKEMEVDDADKEIEAKGADKETKAEGADKETKAEGAEMEAKVDAADKETEADAADKEKEVDAVDKKICGMVDDDESSAAVDDQAETMRVNETKNGADATLEKGAGEAIQQAETGEGADEENRSGRKPVENNKDEAFEAEVMDANDIKQESKDDAATSPPPDEVAQDHIALPTTEDKAAQCPSASVVSVADALSGEEGKRDAQALKAEKVQVLAAKSTPENTVSGDSIVEPEPEPAEGVASEPDKIVGNSATIDTGLDKAAVFEKQGAASGGSDSPECIKDDIDEKKEVVAEDVNTTKKDDGHTGDPDETAPIEVHALIENESSISRKQSAITNVDDKQRAHDGPQGKTSAHGTPEQIPVGGALLEDHSAVESRKDNAVIAAAKTSERETLATRIAGIGADGSEQTPGCEVQKSASSGDKSKDSPKEGGSQNKDLLDTVESTGNEKLKKDGEKDQQHETDETSLHDADSFHTPPEQPEDDADGHGKDIDVMDSSGVHQDGQLQESEGKIVDRLAPEQHPQASKESATRRTEKGPGSKDPSAVAEITTTSAEEAEVKDITVANDQPLAVESNKRGVTSVPVNTETLGASTTTGPAEDTQTRSEGDKDQGVKNNETDGVISLASANAAKTVTTETSGASFTTGPAEDSQTRSEGDKDQEEKVNETDGAVSLAPAKAKIATIETSGASTTTGPAEDTQTRSEGDKDQEVKNNETDGVISLASANNAKTVTTETSGASTPTGPAEDSQTRSEGNKDQEEKVNMTDGAVSSALAKATKTVTIETSGASTTTGPAEDTQTRSGGNKDQLLKVHETDGAASLVSANAPKTVATEASGASTPTGLAEDKQIVRGGDKDQESKVSKTDGAVSSAPAKPPKTVTTETSGASTTASSAEEPPGKTETLTTPEQKDGGNSEVAQSVIPMDIASPEPSGEKKRGRESDQDLPEKARRQQLKKPRLDDTIVKAEVSPALLPPEDSVEQEAPKATNGRADLDRIKMLLFSTGSLAHRGRGFERIFSEYWGALSLIVAGKHSGAELVKLRGVVKSFLKTKRLRKLHNRLIMGKLSAADFDSLLSWYAFLTFFLGTLQH
jgi:hypothetical protein